MDTKRCFACGQTKPTSMFYRSNVHYFQKECKECCRTRKYRWHKTDAGKRSSANTKLKRRFGITIEQYEEMLAAQGGKCAICGATESYMKHGLAVDHCHATGQVRALLCKGCNIGIGNLRDSAELCARAARYLSAHAVVANAIGGLRTKEKLAGVSK